MENTNTILNEVRGISPVVADIGNHHPYSVPPAYFDNLAVQLLLRIAIEEKAGADPVLNISKGPLYQAPNGYFEELAGNIMQLISTQETGNAREELELLSPLLGQIGKKNPFTPPHDYFNEFSENVVAGVKAIEFVNEELENLSPVMSALKDKKVYEAPAGYFADNITNILAKAKQQPAKIFSIGFSKTMLRYAAAAVVVGIIAISTYFLSAVDGKPGKIVGIGNHNKPAWDSTGVAKIPDQEIENFLNNNTISFADVNAAATEDNNSTPDDPKDLLADISDEELRHYLEQHGGTPDIITN